MNTDDSATTPVSITLPCGEVIEVDGVPYEGWGSEPGKWYSVVELGDADNPVWQRSWSIQRV